LHARDQLDDVARQIDQYFAGSRRAFDLVLDRQLSTGFRASVLSQIGSIEYGRTASYSAVAKLMGNPKASRAVGNACATNPLPVLVPCHRVISSTGGLGGYLGGPEAKRTLLTLEATAYPLNPPLTA
jgi:methylated-DNA-[protein]-cysteine S-methyltransferase